MIFYLGATLIAGVVIWIIIHPLFTGRSALAGRAPEEPTEAESRKRIALLALRDAEHDHAAGKLDIVDYRELRSELAAEAIEAIAQVDRARARDAAEGEALSEPGVEYCSECEHELEPASRFCSACGAKVNPTADWDD